MSHISNQDLLAELLKGPFSHFKKIGQDDWRDPSEKNPSFSLSSKGYIDHKSGTSGSLNDLAKEKNLLILNNHQPASFSQSNTQLKKSSAVDIQRIWEKSEIADHPESKSAALIRSYLTNYRKIPFNSYADLLRKGLIRMNEYKGERMLVYPSLSAKTLNDAIEGKPYTVFRIQRIFVDDKGDKLKKKHLGSNLEDPAGFVIPPLNDTGEHLAVIAEGLEDALSIRAKFKDAWIFVAADKAGLKHTSGFFSDGKFKSVLIVADHDTDQNPAITGQAEAWRLGEKLISMGVKSVQVKMPSVPKDDANQALQDGRLSDWLNSLFDIPNLFRINENETSKMREFNYNNVQKGNLRIVKASEVKPKQIRWLWPGVIAQGKLIVIAGDPGLGKSQVSLFICATISSGGIWPVSGESSQEGNVLILSAEDGAEDTIVPRLMALGANLDRIHLVQSMRFEKDKERTFNLTSDIEHLRKETKQIGEVKLLVIDPISAYMGKTDSHKNAEVRSALTPAIEFVEEIGASLLCVTHLTKGGNSRNVMNFVTGSIAFTAAARATYIVTKENDDPDRRLMLPLKNNLAKDTNGYGYRIEERFLTNLNPKINTSCVIWEKEFVNMSAEEVFFSENRSSHHIKTENFLLQELAEGCEVSCNELYEKAEKLGISRKTLRTVKNKIKVDTRKDGYQGQWLWSLPNNLNL